MTSRSTSPAAGGPLNSYFRPERVVTHRADAQNATIALVTHGVNPFGGTPGQHFCATRVLRDLPAPNKDRRLRNHAGYRSMVQQ